jgi:hypothetical protein
MTSGRLDENAPVVACRKCGTEQAVTAKGPLTAHRCLHGFVCVAAEKKRKKHHDPCPLCRQEGKEAKP